MSDIVFALLIWIGQNTDYTVAAVQPNVVMVESYQLCRHYGVSDRRQCEAMRLKGFYDKDLTVYLSHDEAGMNQDQQGRLLHELVHWVQWRNGRNAVSDCMGLLEAEAYELQDSWRSGQGLEARADAFTLMMLKASCEDEA